MVGGPVLPSAARSVRDGIWAATDDFQQAATVRPDGAVDIFDLSSGGRLVERLAAPPERAGGRPCTLAISSKRGRTPPFTVAFGTDGGNVTLDGDHVASLQQGRVGKVFMREGVLVACGGGDKEVVVVNLETKKVARRLSVAKDHRNALSALALNSDGTRAVVCSQNVSLLDIAMGTTLRSYSGHATPVSAACFFSDGTRIITGSAGDQYLYIWDAKLDSDQSAVEATSSGKKKKRRKKGSSSHPLHTLVAPENGVRSISVVNTENGEVSICALLKSGSTAVWRNWSLKKKDHVTKSDVVILPQAPEASYAAPSVHTAGFSSSSTISVLYGSTLKPNVYSQKLNDAPDVAFLPEATATNMLLPSKATMQEALSLEQRENTANLLEREASAPEAINASQIQQKPLSDVNASSVPRRKREKRKGADSAEALANGLPNGVRSSKTKEDSADSEDSEQSSVDDGNAAGDGDSDIDEEESGWVAEDQEPTLRERLFELGVGTRPETDQRKPQDPKNEKEKMYTSQAEVILQAIKSNDKKLLESTLLKSVDPVSAAASVRRLPSAIASGALLEFLVILMNSRPKHVRRAVIWIQAIISEHAGVMISQPKTYALSKLLDSIRIRVDALEPLHRLEGRLDLVIAQAKRTMMLRNATKMPRPQVQYVEKVSSMRKRGKAVEESSDSSSDEDSDIEEAEDETGDFSNSGESSDESDEDSEDVEMTNPDADIEGATRKSTANGYASGASGEDDDDSDSEDDNSS